MNRKSPSLLSHTDNAGDYSYSITDDGLLSHASLLDNVSDIIVATDVNHHIKSWNRAAEKAYNFNREDVLNRHYSVFFDIVFIGTTLQEVRTLLHEHDCWSGEVFVTPKGGTPLKLKGTTIVTRNTSGAIERYITINRDVTNEWQTLEDLMYKQNEFKSFMENAPLMVWINDENGKLYYMNSRFRNNFQLTDAAIGKNVYDLYPEVMRPHCIASDQQVLEEKCCVDVFEEGMDEAGEKIFYKVFKFPVQGTGEKRLIGGQALDITESVENRQALEKSNERFAYAGKATRDVIWDWDLERNKIQRIGGFNVIFGHDANEDLIDFDSDNIHPDDIDTVTASWQKAMNGTDLRWQNEFRYRCADGSYKIVVDQAYIIRNEAGDAVRLIGSMQDITEERRLQQELLEAELRKKQERISAAIEAQEKERHEIAGELHDNVNQLLAATLLYLKTARKNPENAVAMVDQGFAYVEKAIAEIRQITHNLSPANVMVNGLCAALRDFTEKIVLAGSLFVELLVEQDFEEALLVPHLQLALYRIVQEALNNTVKYAGADKVTISITTKSNLLKLDFADNGKGFDMRTVNKGLGLINIRNRVESFHGTAEFISAPGHGSTISVEIPL